jgi:integrase/recombinase XerD
MTTAAPSTALATIQPAFTDAERFALAGFLAGYRGLTREAYALDLRQFTTWCRVRSLALFDVRRADIESFARDLEAKGRARATVTRRLCTIAGFCKYAVEEHLLEHSPAAHVRRPRVDYESHAVALDRNELGALLVAAGLGTPVEHALISLLALNGLRVSEAVDADTDHLGLERGHRTLTITRKGGKVVTIPLAPRTARAIDLAVGERTEGPMFLDADGRRVDRHGAGRIVRKVARRAGIAKIVTPHTLRNAFIIAALDAGCRCAMCKKLPLIPIRTPRCGTTGPVAAWTGTPLTSSPPTSRAPPGKPHRPASLPGGPGHGEGCSALSAQEAITRCEHNMNANRRSERLATSRADLLGRAYRRLSARHDRALDVRAASGCRRVLSGSCCSCSPGRTVRRF